MYQKVLVVLAVFTAIFLTGCGIDIPIPSFSTSRPAPSASPSLSPSPLPSPTPYTFSPLEKLSPAKKDALYERLNNLSPLEKTEMESYIQNWVKPTPESYELAQLIYFFPLGVGSYSPKFGYYRYEPIINDFVVDYPLTWDINVLGANDIQMYSPGVDLIRPQISGKTPTQDLRDREFSVEVLKGCYGVTKDTTFEEYLDISLARPYRRAPIKLLGKEDVVIGDRQMKKYTYTLPKAKTSKEDNTIMMEDYYFEENNSFGVIFFEYAPGAEAKYRPEAEKIVSSFHVGPLACDRSNEIFSPTQMNFLYPRCFSTAYEFVTKSRGFLFPDGVPDCTKLM